MPIFIFFIQLEMHLRVPGDFSIICVLFCFSHINQFFYNLLQVEALHDFEAANADELTLQRGDVVLVVPSDSEADQVKAEDAMHADCIFFVLRISWIQ